MSELYFRMTKYDTALMYANKILHINTYNPRANFLAGQAYWGLKDAINAKESFSWAARDMKYRSVANELIAEILLTEEKFLDAIHYLKTSLEYNINNLNALSALAYTFRKSGKKAEASKMLQKKIQIRLTVSRLFLTTRKNSKWIQSLTALPDPICQNTVTRKYL